MGSDYIKKDGKLLNVITGKETIYTGQNQKFYAVVLKCGHCGTGYYIPVIKGIMAPNMDIACKFARETGRVKRTNKDYLIAICEISQVESMLIQNINTQDPYFSSLSKYDVNEEEIINRRIMNEDRLRACVEKNQVPEFNTADKIDEYYVVERYCAPSIVGNKIIYPKHINVRQMLTEFFDVKMVRHGLERGTVTALSLYIQIRGDDNPLGIKYNNGIISYKDTNGNIKHIELTGGKRSHVDAVMQKRRKEKEDDIIAIEELKNKMPTKVDRFKARLAKTVKLQANNNDESGSER